jgi:hypothetical protein
MEKKKKKAVKAIEKSVRKAVHKGVTEHAVEQAVERSIDEVARNKKGHLKKSEADKLPKTKLTRGEAADEENDGD